MNGKFLSDLDEKLRCSDTGDESYSYRCEMSSSETKSWIIEVIKLYFIVPTNEQSKSVYFRIWKVNIKQMSVKGQDVIVNNSAMTMS